MCQQQANYMVIILAYYSFSYLQTLNDWHYKEILIHFFPEKELRGLSPNFHIHVTVSDLYIPRIGPPIFLQQNMQTDRGNK